MSIDNSTAIVARPAGVRRFARAALFAGAIALGAGVFGHTAIASAEWDIEKYDKCMANPHTEDPGQTYHSLCCFASGGIWDADTNKCRAPADRIQNIQNIPLGPKLGSTPQSGPPTNTLGTPVS
ncbi:MAG TPA: hypothetical protein VFB19_14845 [Mycobacterium sp.]|nr:hypothetical protein [Mycobacterium sp.]